MLDDIIEIEESQFPKSMVDTRVLQYARELGDQYEQFKEGRAILAKEIWPRADLAFKCIRDSRINRLIPSMKFVDNGMLGESVIRELTKSLRQRIIQGVVPGDGSFVEAVSMDPDTDDDEATLEKVKGMMLDRSKQSGLISGMSPFVDQLLVRGTSAMGIHYSRRRKVRRVPKQMSDTLQILAEGAEMVDDQGNPTDDPKKAKIWKDVYKGSRVYPIDMHRLMLDPQAELGIEDETAFIYTMFKTLADLEGAKDDQGKPLYDKDALEGIHEISFNEWYGEHPEACESTKILGIDPTLDKMGKFVPVYLFYKQTRKFEDGELYVDKFFYLTRTAAGGEWRIIRVQENPSDFGHCPFYVTQLDRWLNHPYGTSLVEKSLSQYKALNIMSAVALNAGILTVFPPFFYPDGVMKDDNKPTWMPGGMQKIIIRPGIGMDWLRPYPVTPQQALIGMQEQRYISEKITGQMGSSASGVINEPTKSMAKSKTATEIRQQSTDGVVSEEEIIDKINDDVLEPIEQAMYDYERQYGDDGAKFMSTGQDGRSKMQQLSAQELNVDRKIRILGRQGLASKAHEMDNLMKLLELLSQPEAAQVLATLPLILQTVLLKIIARLGLAIQDSWKVPPEQLLASSPVIMQMAIQKALQDPKMREQIGQELVNSPEGQAFVNHLEQEIKQRTLAEHGQQQQAVKQEASQQVAQQKQMQQAAMQGQGGMQ